MGAEGAASLEGERWRLFIAFPLPEAWVARIAAWQSARLSSDERLRLVPRENLHVTLVFLGSVERACLPAIEEELREASGTARRPELSVTGVAGTRSVAMLVLDDRDGHAAQLQRDLAKRLAAGGLYEPEKRVWTPHVTVGRHRLGKRLQLRVPAPELAAWGPSEVAVMLSGSHGRGVRYEAVKTLAIGGSRG